MTCYPLINLNGNGKLKMPTRTMNNEEHVHRFHDLYLTAELGRKYRLHATHAHTMDDYLSYDIMCPSCAQLLTPAGAPIDHYNLGLYACNHCGKR